MQHLTFAQVQAKLNRLTTEFSSFIALAGQSVVWWSHMKDHVPVLTSKISQRELDLYRPQDNVVEGWTFLADLFAVYVYRVKPDIKFGSIL